MQYIGARYVPKFMGTFDPTQAYENMCVVDNGLGTSYISVKPTPAGTPLTDTDYWALYGASNGAIINLQNQIDAINDDLLALSSQTYLLSNFEGDTPEEKLYKALDTITAGIISLNMDVEIDHTYYVSTKDYRRIAIANGNIHLNINYMFDNGSDQYKGMTVPCFVNCNISSDQKIIFNNSFVVSPAPSDDRIENYPGIAGIKFVNCYIYKTVIADTTGFFLQSCHAINCEFRECDRIVAAKAYTDLRFISNQFERTVNYIIKSNINELPDPAYQNYYSILHAVIAYNVIEYTRGTMFIFGKATDIRIIGNYFEDNDMPYCRPGNRIQIFEMRSNYFNEYDYDSPKYLFDFGYGAVQKLVSSDNAFVFGTNVTFMFPEHINPNDSSISQITANGGSYSTKLEPNNMYMLTWTKNGGADFYIEMISVWTLATHVTHVVNSANDITTSIDSNGVLTVSTGSTGQYRLLKL